MFYSLILLMSLSLIGIIFVQGYWIKNTLDTKEEQFSFNARQILSNVAEQIEKEEFEAYYFRYLSKADSLEKPIKTIIDELFGIDEDPLGEYYTNPIGIREDKKLFSAFLSGNRDSLVMKSLIREKIGNLVNRDQNEKERLTAEDRFARINQMDRVMRDWLSAAIRENLAKLPLYQRIDEERVEELISHELKKRDMTTDFEFAVYSNSLATTIKSNDFQLNAPTTYSMPIFEGNDSVWDHEYLLLVNFTEKNTALFSSIALMVLLSIIFTLIIVVAYSSAISQLLKQRQISQIKTDFINNMTHEFKTPIATINLALDSVKNKKIRDDEEKMERYLKMIRDENNRMHAQVENVLRISKLENDDLDIKKERLKLHDLIENAIAHVCLILEDRNGQIHTHFNAKRSSILANKSHFTNVIVNILDNAVKYSESPPKIDIYTENVKNYIVMKIQDQGSGMSKAAQRKVFEKFFREHTGNIHNVKGHGLGLAYVKRILDDHHGQISVESQKGKGSTFIVKLPLIS